MRNCDSHHNTGVFSGTDSHGTLVAHNNFYDNSLGFTTDVFTASGHPGFPQHGNTLRNNDFYSNNFNPYQPGSDVEPFIASPVGTGMWLAGGNANRVKNNWFYDNWRRGTMLFGVPDATVCGPPPAGSGPVQGCDPTGVSTSYDNRFTGNHFGVTRDGKVMPNGLDMWWDSFPGNTGNCFWDNSAAPGASLKTSPLVLPDCNGGTQPELSVGTGDVQNESELAACLAGFTVSGYPDGNSTVCDWTTTPDKPSSDGGVPVPSAARQQAQEAELNSICDTGLSPRLCAPYADVLNRLTGMVTSAAESFTSPLATATPAYTPGRLSSFTCSWWRQADDDHRLGMVQRIRNLDSGRINGSPGDFATYGYGAGLSDARAGMLFDDRCSTFEAGPFALYKIYGAAAPFAAFTG